MSFASVGGTFLALISISFLKPLLSANQPYRNVLPFQDKDSDGVTNLFLTLHLPQPLADNTDSDFDMKRQFDPWGGKRQSKTLQKEEDIGRKRQFSPWGGKRSFNNHLTSFWLDDAKLKKGKTSLLDNTNYRRKDSKRDFNSWGGKRNFNSWGGKRNFNSWGGKREFNSWGGKRNFNAWGGKRSESDPNRSFDDSFLEADRNRNSKRQSFNAWGGKRALPSWEGNFNTSSPYTNAIAEENNQ